MKRSTFPQTKDLTKEVENLSNFDLTVAWLSYEQGFPLLQQLEMSKAILTL